MNKKTILTGLLIFMMNHPAVNSKECGNSENINYEVNMKYVDYDTLASADLPLRPKFNLNEEDEEDQALEYQDGDTDTIITISRNSIIQSEITFGFFEEQEKVQLLDDTGFFTAHFLVQNLMKQANKEGEIDPAEHKQQIKRIKEQLKKFKELVEKIKEFDIFAVHTTAEDVEDSIGNEWFEGDGVLDVLDKDPIDVKELAQHWAALMQDISFAKDIRVQAYVLDEYSGHWSVINTRSAWKGITAQDILPIYSVKKHHNVPVVGPLTSVRKLAVNKLETVWNHEYYARAADAQDHPLDVLRFPAGHCASVNSRIMGRPRNTIDRVQNIFRDEKKNSSQGGHSVQ